jgi:HSP20 family molecular chaperone IbpA
MWGEALALLEQADRLHRQLMGPSPRGATWEPPVDVIETADEVVVHVALPGVSPAEVAIGTEPGAITVQALRPFPGGAAESRIHRIEIPYGRFERRIPVALVRGVLDLTEKRLRDGCLTLRFAKTQEVA